jgi:hypothetical protein
MRRACDRHREAGVCLLCGGGSCQVKAWFIGFDSSTRQPKYRLNTHTHYYQRFIAPAPVRDTDDIKFSRLCVALDTPGQFNQFGMCKKHHIAPRITFRCVASPGTPPVCSWGVPDSVWMGLCAEISCYLFLTLLTVSHTKRNNMCRCDTGNQGAQAILY